MASKDQELEVKFYVLDLSALHARLQALGAKMSQSRTHETNLRFDTPEGKLARSSQVLRLRQDNAVHLTYKGPSQTRDGIHVRKEIEFITSDFNSTKALLEALGYQVSMMYEKYRAVYELEGVHVTLDELPYGDFVELEGPDPVHIHAANQRLGLDWEARILESYTVLFDRLRTTLGLAFRDLSFANFKGLEISPSAMNVRPADISHPPVKQSPG